VDSLFGIPLTSILAGLLAMLAVAFGALGWIAWRSPLLVRMGLRNVRRRKSQTSLIVTGLMLSTLIISAAFATGDTVGYSITNTIYASFEEVDFIIGRDSGGISGPAGASPIADDLLPDQFLAELQAEFANDPEIDAISGVVLKTLPALNEERRLSEPNAQFVGLEPITAAEFNGLNDPDGNPVPADALIGNRVYITVRLSEDIDAKAGDTIAVFVDNKRTELEVIGIVRDTSLTDAGSNGLTGGIAINIESAREIVDTPEGVSFIAVSSLGGTRGTLDLSDGIQDRLEAFIDLHPEAEADVVLTKKQIVAFGELIGSIFVTFFLVFGLFSIAAGIMLIFLIFIMLAAERRAEMGMARAVGMKRIQLTQSFLVEGMAYNIGSAAIGALLGLAVAGALIAVMGRIFDDFGLSITFHFNWQGFAIAYSLGVVLTFITVVFSAWRAANLNIVRAIRDLPEPAPLVAADRSAGRLARAALGVLWPIAWIILAPIWVLVGFQLLLANPTPYVVTGLAGLAALAAWFTFGARKTTHPFRTRMGWWRRTIYILWWLVFTVVGLMAPITWGLLRSRDWAARHRNSGGWAVLMIMIGLLLVYMSGWQSAEALGPVGGWMQHKLFAYSAGTTLAILAVAMLAVYFGAGSRLSFTIAGLALVWYWLLPLPFSLFADVTEGRGLDPIHGVFRVVGLPVPQELNGNIEMFFVSGICITAAATLVTIFNADVVLRVLNLFGHVFGGIAPAVRTAIAYPLAAKTRTGLTLAMFGLVVLSLVVMATLNFNFTQLFLGDDATAGFDVVVDANPSNRIPDLLTALTEGGYDGYANVGGVGTMVTAFPQMKAGDDDFHRFRLQGLDDSFLQLAKFPLQFRANGYDSDEAVLQALRDDPTVAIVDAGRLHIEDGFGGGPPGEGRFELPVSANDLREGPWDPIPVTMVTDDGERVVHVIGVLEPQVTGVLLQLFALFTGREVVDSALGGGETETFLISAGEDSSKSGSIRLARDIESTLLERGVQAKSIIEQIDVQASQSRAFQLLFESFMGLGLIVGIAALGVIAFRTVVERRQQIGVLRAIGYSRRLVRLSFFMESSFIAITGVGMGLILGIALSYNLLTSPEFTDGAEIQFEIPWIRIGIIVAIAYGASALMTLIPAHSASKIFPAEALRYE
jgi:ABC-type antimicrobial peptide transport system permease subunit